MNKALWVLKVWWVRMTWNPSRDNPPEYWAFIRQAVEMAKSHIRDSSNGRTAGFEPAYLGSNPRSRAKP